MVYDRAAIITQTVRQITTASSIPENERWHHVERALRDEIADIVRQTIADRGRDDA
jgi:hypothetical protein